MALADRTRSDIDPTERFAIDRCAQGRSRAPFRVLRREVVSTGVLDDHTLIEACRAIDGFCRLLPADDDGEAA